MRSVIAGFLALVVGVTMTFHSDDAFAKRFGGAKSFGGKSSFSQPQKRSTVKAPDKAAAPANGTAAAGGAAAGGAAAAGAKGGMMGVLGGLAIGGLLGAMFFGGAFENINFLDILVFGLIAFLLFKLFAGRRRPMEPQAAGAYGSPEAYQEEPARNESVQTRQSNKGFDTDLMFKNRPSGAAPAMAAEAVSAPVSVPRDFDQEHFMEGAKTLFARMQQAWDEGDLGDIRQFSTDKVFGEVQDQFHQRQGENRTEILDLAGELVRYNGTDNELEASVLFKANLVEHDLQSGENPQAVEVEEVWHFIKPKHSIQPTWYLDGIQQLED